MCLQLYVPAKITPADVVKCKNLRTLEIISKHMKLEKSRTILYTNYILYIVYI